MLGKTTFKAASRSMAGLLLGSALLLVQVQIQAASIQWTFRSGAPIRGGVLPDQQGGVVFGNLAGQVFSLDAQQKLRWQRKLAGAISTTPLKSGSLILLTSSQGVSALDATTGAQRWQYTMPEHAPGDIWDSLNPEPILLGQQLLVALGRELVLLDVAQGKPVWRQALAEVITATPAIDGQIAYLASEYGTLSRVVWRSGKLLSQHRAADGMIQSQPVRVGKSLVFASRDGKIRGWDIQQRKTRWEVDHGGSWVMASALADRGRIVIGSSDSFLVQQIDGQSGRVIWQVPSRQNIFRQAVLAHEQYWFATGDTYAPAKAGQLLAINRQGQQTQRLELPAAAFGQLRATATSLLVGAENGVLYAIKPD
ncbi:PQQ-binding-like beta-propeller repeat protein [Chitinibacter sp. GC72]|uniref:outer membrane protein assembly factor BamB family protein n=1 Tax=Chitinibacter sp. GC72 TaxID=1526917 RepID=UPI0012FA8E64|nr:PQQ-binding-like beta-propeller repeat protein [Chitinibacter sp. GC72]